MKLNELRHAVKLTPRSRDRRYLKLAGVAESSTLVLNRAKRTNRKHALGFKLREVDIQPSHDQQTTRQALGFIPACSWSSVSPPTGGGGSFNSWELLTLHEADEIFVDLRNVIAKAISKEFDSLFRPGKFAGSFLADSIQILHKLLRFAFEQIKR